LTDDRVLSVGLEALKGRSHMGNDESTAGGFFMGLVLAIFLAFIVGAHSCDSGINQVRAEAVKEGKAEYVVTDEWGKTEFRWKK
jgi:hypothetical protein